MKQGGPLKRKTPLKRKRATKRTTKSAAGCAGSKRCTVTILSVVVSPLERYCHAHGKKKLDKLVGDYVKRRDKVCTRCGSPGPLDWSHLISRGAPWLRWDLDNSVAHCKGCHWYFTAKPSAMNLWIEERWPGRLSELTQREAAAEKAGGHINIAVLIREYRRRLAA